ncbi:MTH938/NDUFAF3 family protein [Devosia sp. XJ19-1]|uniref:MTH938/NDUFAF3 family protein n=1 Tax=Devosia ureilytica TaxID=2952754 RepID=A0A9Q4ALN2_9HYPH|nr:MTH938/NDUFAF3 family protein [Devosia ureilytica]MCP8882139.1 MTH938/NDUFAF3 family protein [Devosia ureilytica]MCP8885975.1 MTH938/NDUFAF3 family protein [Devosia ureilytica]
MALPSETASGAGGRFPRQVGIDAYGNGGFRFAEMSHKGSLLCLPDGMSGWDMPSAAELTLESLAPVLEQAQGLDVLLIGLGSDIVAIDPAIRHAFRDRKVIIEATQTGGAVRTYNVLLAEQRAVGAALIAVENAR